MTAKQRPRGRPPLAKGQERDEVVTIRLRASERARLERAARKAGKPLSTWAREALMDEAEGGR